MKQHDLLYGRQARQLHVGFGEAFLLFLLASMIVMMCASGQVDAAEKSGKQDLHSELKDKLGIEIVGLRRSAAGYMLDFRYRLIDPAKASQLLDRKIQPYLLDEATGAQLSVPDAPKVGQLRPTSRNNVIPGRNYYILFANPGRYLLAGSQVTLIAGDIRINHLTVE